MMIIIIKFQDSNYLVIVYLTGIATNSRQENRLEIPFYNQNHN